MMKLSVTDMSGHAVEAAAFLKGLASPHRLQILCALSEGEKSVSALIEITGMAQSSMSQHLSKLRAEHIIDYRRDHRTLYYMITNTTAKVILAALYHTFCKYKESKP